MNSSTPWSPTNKRMSLKNWTEPHLRCPRSLRISGLAMPSELLLPVGLIRDFISLTTWLNACDRRVVIINTFVMLKLLALPIHSFPGGQISPKIGTEICYTSPAWYIIHCPQVLVWNTVSLFPKLCSIDNFGYPAYFCTHL